MRKFVYNEKGFFLMEHLIGVIITGILAVSTTVLLHTLRTYQTQPLHLTQHEVETLATRLQQEAAFATFLPGPRHQFNLQIGSSHISYVFQNNRISRLVNGRGGEIALYNVANFEVFPGNNQSSLLEITSYSGNSYTIFLTNFLPEVLYES